MHPKELQAKLSPGLWTDVVRGNITEDYALQLTDLERENAELRADKARLDWLEDNSGDVYEIHGDWHVYTDRGLASPGLRLAIDAARAAKS